MALWAGVVTYELKAGKKAKATSIWEEYVRPFVNRQKNCVGSLWMVAQGEDRAISVDFWDNALSASAFESTGLFKTLTEHFDAVLTQPPRRTEFQADDAFAFAGEPAKAKGLDFKLMETMTISVKPKKTKD
jgi:hypothetical protein